MPLESAIRSQADLTQEGLETRMARRESDDISLRALLSGPFVVSNSAYH